jgi:uncharacterized protein YjbI with pentapeptide repeats
MIVRNIFNSPVKTAILITSLTLILIIYITSYWEFVSSSIFPNTVIGLYEKSFWENILVEMHGMVIELIIVGILVIWLDSRRSKNNEVIRLIEDLEDYAELDFPEINVKKLGHLKRLNSAGIKEINVQNLLLNHLKLRNLSIENSKMIGLKVFNGGLYNTNFSNVNMRSSNFENATIQNSIFKNCILLKSNFKDGICKGVSFEKSSIERVDYTNCNLQSSLFLGCDMRGVKLQGANLKQCSFKEVIHLDINELAKASCLDYIAISDDLLEQLKIIRPDMKYQRRGIRT